MTIPKRFLVESMTYTDYLEMVRHLLSQNKTTGPNQSEAMIHYTDMSVRRMDRLNRTVKLLPELESAARVWQAKPTVWLTITEGWCGDAAHALPVIHRLAEEQGHITLRCILRDEHPELIDRFLTNGSRSIPKVLVTDPESGEVHYVWGPRPAPAQNLVMKGRDAMQAIGDETERKAFYQNLQIELQKWYARDKTRTIQLELAEGLASAKKRTIML
jgi:hypothetical protein